MEIAVLIVISLISIFVGISLKGTDYNQGMIIISSIIVFAIIFMSVVALQINEKMYYKEGYKDGQIQCIQGNINYHVDSVATWVENKKQ